MPSIWKTLCFRNANAATRRVKIEIRKLMNTDQRLHALANQAAEEILQTIFGADFTGCNVPIDSISSIVYDTLVAERTVNREMLELYEKANEAMRLAATPPPNANTLDPNQLRSLLGARLDMVRELTERIAAAGKGAEEGSAE